jgi:hypothetical protein
MNKLRMPQKPDNFELRGELSNIRDFESLLRTLTALCHETNDRLKYIEGVSRYKKTKPPYEPEWINEAEVEAWLGVTKMTLWRWRNAKGLAWTNVNGRSIMYDKKQIIRMLNAESTYRFMGVNVEYDK